MLQAISEGAIWGYVEVVIQRKCFSIILPHPRVPLCAREPVRRLGLSSQTSLFCKNPNIHLSWVIFCIW